MIKIRQFVPQEFCLQCKSCCRFGEMESVWTPKLLKEEKQDGAFKDKDFTLLPQPGNSVFLCPFLEQGSDKCRIYSSRPFECVIYPFLLNRKQDRCFLAVDLNCPYIENTYKTHEFQEYVKYLTELFANPDFTAILKNNPQIILPYDGALNVAEILI